MAGTSPRGGDRGADKAGVDASRWAWVRGRSASTRVVAGVGVPQAPDHAVREGGEKKGVTVVADGWIQVSVDITESDGGGGQFRDDRLPLRRNEESPGEMILYPGPLLQGVRGMGR